MLVNSFRFQIGQVVFVREDLAKEYCVKPNTPCKVESLTINSRGTFAHCSWDGGRRRLTIDEKGLVLTNTRPNTQINRDPVPA